MSWFEVRRSEVSPKSAQDGIQLATSPDTQQDALNETKRIVGGSRCVAIELGECSARTRPSARLVRDCKLSRLLSFKT